MAKENNVNRHGEKKVVWQERMGEIKGMKRIKCLARENGVNMHGEKKINWQERRA